MSADTGHAERETDAFESVRAHRDALETVGAERTDRLGAAARVFVALADGERPTDADLVAAGLPTPDELGGGK